MLAAIPDSDIESNKTEEDDEVPVEISTKDLKDMFI